MIAWLKGNIKGCPFGGITGIGKCVYFSMRTTHPAVISRTHDLTVFDNHGPYHGIR
jgi:hypothetical protein